MRVLVTGVSGLLGGYLMRELKSRSLDVVGWLGPNTYQIHDPLFGRYDLAEPRWVSFAFREVAPDLLIHAGALASVEACRRDPEKARQVNTTGTSRLAELAAAKRARMLHISTDLVFDGIKGNYHERDATGPLSVYARTKLDAEEAVEAYPGHAVARLSLLFGPKLTGRAGFFDQQVVALRSGSPLTLFEDEWRTPLSLITAARALVTLALSDYCGLIHIGGPERMSRLEMGQRLARYLGADTSPIVVASRDSVPTAEPRPRDTSLDSSRWRRLFPEMPWPQFEEALRELIVGDGTP
jgi:dTDP-4-dehydrorhamnose reductase